MVCGAAGLVVVPQTREVLRVAAAQRWAARIFESYRLSVQVLRGEHVLLLHDTCRVGWPGTLHAGWLFVWRQRLERAPECFPSANRCSCERVRAGQGSFDLHLGLPQQITLRRYVRPNPLHLHYWEALVTSRTIPARGPNIQQLEITVVAITPL